ncbi:MAG: hypothetical protein AABY93_11505 [Bacteroidota bacterium]
MKGFSGPFRFEIDENGTLIQFNELDQVILKTLSSDGISSLNSKIYKVKISAFADLNSVQKNHDWAKVKRIFIEINSKSKSVYIVGIYPREQKSKGITQTELDFIKTIKGNIKLFNALQFKLSVDNPVKLLARLDRYAVLSSFSNRKAQWVFSEGWEELEFKLYIYIVIPNALDKDEKYIDLIIKPTLKKNKELKNVSVWNRKVFFPE